MIARLYLKEQLIGCFITDVNIAALRRFCTLYHQYTLEETDDENQES